MTRWPRQFPLRPVLLVPVLLGMTLGPSGRLDADTPKEIVIDQPVRPAEPLTDFQKQAVDTALLLGAVEIARSARSSDELHPYELQFYAEADRCYVVTGFANRKTLFQVEWTFGQSPDGKPMSLAGAGGIYQSHKGGQFTARFCVDRPGPVNLKVSEMARDQSDYAYWHGFQMGLAIGWRPESLPQREVRMRRVAAKSPEFQSD